MDKRPCYFCKRKLDPAKALQCMGVGNFAHWICFDRHDAPRTVEYLESQLAEGVKLTRRNKGRLRAARNLVAKMSLSARKAP